MKTAGWWSCMVSRSWRFLCHSREDILPGSNCSCLYLANFLACGLWLACFIIHSCWLTRYNKYHCLTPFRHEYKNYAPVPGSIPVCCMAGDNEKWRSFFKLWTLNEPGPRTDSSLLGNVVELSIRAYSHSIGISIWFNCESNAPP